MYYTVKKLSSLSGVSVRTLHFYDEIGLLAPVCYGENGYRYYNEEKLLILQQILFFREVGFNLQQIKNILNSPDFNKIQALKTHRQVLIQQQRRLAKLLINVNKTILKLQKGESMNPKDLYLGFAPIKQQTYEKEIENKFGALGREKMQETKDNLSRWDESDYQQVKKHYDELHQAFALAIKNDHQAGDEEVQKLVAQHYKLISKFYNPTREIYQQLGDMYVEHLDFKQMYDEYHPKLAEFLRESMKIFAQKNL